MGVYVCILYDKSLLLLLLLLEKDGRGGIFFLEVIDAMNTFEVGKIVGSEIVPILVGFAIFFFLFKKKKKTQQKRQKQEND